MKLSVSMVSPRSTLPGYPLVVGSHGSGANAEHLMSFWWRVTWLLLLAYRLGAGCRLLPCRSSAPATPGCRLRAPPEMEEAKPELACKSSS